MTEQARACKNKNIIPNHSGAETTRKRRIKSKWIAQKSNQTMIYRRYVSLLARGWTPGSHLRCHLGLTMEEGRKGARGPGCREGCRGRSL